MSDLVKWDPFKEMSRVMQEVEKCFDRIWNSFPENIGAQAAGKATLAVKDEGREIVISGEIPGAEKDKLDVALHEDFVVISGEKISKNDENTGGGLYWSRFRQVHSLPARVRSREAQVKFEDGKLLIRAPKI